MLASSLILSKIVGISWPLIKVEQSLENLWFLWLPMIPRKKHAEKKMYFYLGFIEDSHPIKSWNLLKTHKIHLLRPPQPLPTTPFKTPSANSTCKSLLHQKTQLSREMDGFLPHSRMLLIHKHASQKKGHGNLFVQDTKGGQLLRPAANGLKKSRLVCGRNFHTT